MKDDKVENYVTKAFKFSDLFCYGEKSKAKMTVATVLPPIKPRYLSGPRFKAKLKQTHCYKLRHIREERFKLRRLGSGFFPPIASGFHITPVMLDSVILGHLLPRMPVK